MERNSRDKIVEKLCVYLNQAPFVIVARKKKILVQNIEIFACDLRKKIVMQLLP